jgi:hypothetical protein
MLNNSHKRTVKDQAMNAAQAAQAAQAQAKQAPEPMTEADLLECVEIYNQVEKAAHGLKSAIFGALTLRHGYKRILIGADAFDGTEGAFAYTENEMPRLMKVESLGNK